MSDRSPPPLARVILASAIILAILAAFLYRVAAPTPVEPWLVVLVSLLGLAAASAVLGSDAVRTAFAVFDELRR